jgi:hypothetical protein
MKLFVHNFHPEPNCFTTSLRTTRVCVNVWVTYMRPSRAYFTETFPSRFRDEFNLICVQQNNGKHCSVKGLRAWKSFHKLCRFLFNILCASSPFFIFRFFFLFLRAIFFFEGNWRKLSLPLSSSLRSMRKKTQIFILRIFQLLLAEFPLIIKIYFSNNLNFFLAHIWPRF